MWDRIIAGLIAVLVSILLVRADGINIPSNYQQGTWTPTLIGASTPGTGQTYTTQSGSYEQIGRQVTIRFNILATSLGTAAGGLRISSLPITAANVADDNGVCTITFYTVSALGALSYGITGLVAPNTAVIIPYQNTNTGSSVVTVTQAGASAQLEGFCSYRAS